MEDNRPPIVLRSGSRVGLDPRHVAAKSAKSRNRDHHPPPAEGKVDPAVVRAAQQELRELDDRLSAAILEREEAMRRTVEANLTFKVGSISAERPGSSSSQLSLTERFASAQRLQRLQGAQPAGDVDEVASPTPVIKQPTSPAGPAPHPFYSPPLVKPPPHHFATGSKPSARTWLGEGAAAVLGKVGDFGRSFLAKSFAAAPVHHAAVLGLDDGAALPGPVPPASVSSHQSRLNRSGAESPLSTVDFDDSELQAPSPPSAASSALRQQAAHTPWWSGTKSVSPSSPVRPSLNLESRPRSHVTR